MGKLRGRCIIGPNISVNGYARFPSGKRGIGLYAHRVVWEEAYGPIPVGFHIHHICENKACINVNHLALMTPREHKGEHPAPRQCNHKDRFIDSRGKSVCRECRRQNEKDRYDNDPDFRARKITRAAEYKRRRREGVI